MTTPTERTDRAADYMRGYGISEERGLRIARTLQDAGLLAAPVDGELREALVDALVMTRVSDFAGTDLDVMEETADQLLPLIATHVAEEKRKAAEKAWDEAVNAANETVIHGTQVVKIAAEPGPNPYAAGE